MTKVVDFEARRQVLANKRKDAKATEIRAAFRGARQDAADNLPANQGKTPATRKLLDLYRPKTPKKP